MNKKLKEEVDRITEEKEEVWPNPLPPPTEPKIEREPWPSVAYRRFTRRWPQSFFEWEESRE